MTQRTQEITERLRNGESQVILAREYGLSRQRIEQIARKNDIPKVRVQEKHDGCSVEGCENRHHAKGLCDFHYDRKRHGIPLDRPWGEYPKRDVPIRHGTVAGYSRGCGCEPCREANRIRARDYWHQRHPNRRYYNVKPASEYPKIDARRTRKEKNG